MLKIDRFSFDFTFLKVIIFLFVQVKVGMDLTDVVPRGTNEHIFLEAQNEYFGFYDMHIVTKVSEKLAYIPELTIKRKCSVWSCLHKYSAVVYMMHLM